MKKTHRILMAAGLMSIMCAGWAQSEDYYPVRLEGGPGVAVAGSIIAEQLPDSAQTFLKTYFPEQEIKKAHENFVKRTYEITLSDGVNITFNKEGRVTDISAPSDKPLPPESLMGVLPAPTVQHLLERGVAGQVTWIKHIKGIKSCVILLDNEPPQMIFDAEGNFIIVDG